MHLLIYKHEHLINGLEKILKEQELCITVTWNLRKGGL